MAVTSDFTYSVHLYYTEAVDASYKLTNAAGEAVAIEGTQSVIVIIPISHLITVHPD